MTARPLPPKDYELAQPFWDGCRAGELPLPRCTACRSFIWYPQPVCPACGDDRITWERVSGRGHVFTWTRVHRAFVPDLREPLPFVTALVELEEDARVRLATLLRDVPTDGPRIGMPVAVVFEPAGDGFVLPAFRCVADG